ncbi:septum site-determining protein MinC [Bacillus horti]|uniref:Probable septum site-determining protein MinC n=2 Tax=Caldalkalibacillus horti TaxID=77523 RepID=A0ABT9VTI0_9BACI|nr:septum site-determining protein MinC [Bacillus horti]
MTKPFVTIKGTKDGLVFHMDDTCTFEELLSELSLKLEASRQHALQGEVIKVTVHLGHRYLDQDQEKTLKEFIRTKGKLEVDKLESEVVHRSELDKARIEADVKIVHKTIRSGQVYKVEGNVLVLGDINPGGFIQATGHIFVMGSLRGMAHAGCEGNMSAVIAASILQPTQLRISTVVSRSPDEWDEEEYEMEFAFIENQQIVVDKLHKLMDLRPELKSFI